MKTVYRVNTICGYKPWRSGGPYLIRDKHVFDIVKAMDDDGDFYSLRAPGAIMDEDHPDYDEDHTLADWLHEHCTEKIEPPYILADEMTFYTE